MIALGTYDTTLSRDDIARYHARVLQYTGVVVKLPQWERQLRDEGRWVDYQPLAAGFPFKVADLQRFLREAGFLVASSDDGLCGYRTAAAIFLFQEYVRTVEGQAGIGFPDGRCGPNTAKHVQRWQEAGLKADWAAYSASAPSPEHAQFSKLLNAAQARYAAQPSATMQKVNAARDCDTLKVADWNFDATRVHLVGVRRRRSSGAQQNLDDPFKLLINGLVFTFYGSTEPGNKADDAAKFPYLVPGQHRYRLGWHQHSNAVKIMRALRPGGAGVWVQRSARMIATEAELQGPLDGPNSTINIHWGGDGASDKASWSSGCQVIAGNSYANHRGEVKDCSGFSSINYAGLGVANAKGTVMGKGAMTVLENLVAALSGAREEDRFIYYTLLAEEDLALADGPLGTQTAQLLQQMRSA